MRRRMIGTSVLGALAALVAIAAGSADASSSANVPCSAGATGLVAAVSALNAVGGGSINLEGGCTYSLTPNNVDQGPNGLPVVASAISINGNGATISGARKVRVLDVNGGSGGRLTVNNLTITGGNSPGPGGGLFNNEGTVTLNRVLVTGNTSGAGGGGIASGTLGNGPIGVLTLNNSAVTWNSVAGAMAGGGGGILNHAGMLTLNSSAVDHNTSAGGGGGIASGPGNGNAGGSASLVTLNKSEVNWNVSNGGPMAGGGGIANGSTLVSNNSQVIGNSAPGAVGAGIINHANATLNKTVVAGNVAGDDGLGNSGLGGGIANAAFPIPGAPSPNLVINNSQVTANTASGEGGGIANVGFEVPAGTVTINHTQINANNPDNCFPTIAGCTG